MTWEVIFITNVKLCVSVGGTFPRTCKNYFGHIMVWSFASDGEFPCALSLHYRLINVPEGVDLVVRKPTTMARVPSIRDTFFQRINHDWCSCFSWEPGNGPWGQGLDTVGWETVLGNEFARRRWIPINNIPATWSGLPQRSACSLWTQVYKSFRDYIKKKTQHVSLSGSLAASISHMMII